MTHITYTPSGPQVVIELPEGFACTHWMTTDDAREQVRNLADAIDHHRTVYGSRPKVCITGLREADELARCRRMWEGWGVKVIGREYSDIAGFYRCGEQAL